MRVTRRTGRTMDYQDTNKDDCVQKAGEYNPPHVTSDKTIWREIDWDIPRVS